MASNRDLEATWAYHNGTAHSFRSIHSSRHFLDRQNQPLPFKVYPALELIPLPQLEPSGAPALAASDSEPFGECVPGLELLRLDLGQANYARGPVAILTA